MNSVVLYYISEFYAKNWIVWSFVNYSKELSYILYDSICQIQSKISVFSLFILLSEWRIPKIDFLSIC